MLRLSVVLLLLLLLRPAQAGETSLYADGVADRATDRDRLARNIYRHDFENRRDPDTGLPLPGSADLDGDGWPDFWEPIRAVGFPEYLIGNASIVPDPSGQVPGAYRDVDNRVLHLGFDGTRVGIRTRVPVPVDPGLAYEFSLLHRDSEMAGGRIRAGVDWMRIDPAASRVLRSDEAPDLDTGQIDWPVRPHRLVVNDPPPAANAARLFVIADRLPDSVGGAYHGEVWLDDIALRSLPKILVGAPVPAAGGGQVIPVRYSGLVDNLPDPANPGFFRGKRYHRRAEVTDIFNRPLDLGIRERIAVSPDDGGEAVEEILFPAGGYGVYYFNIRLYDAEDRLSTRVMRSVAVMRAGRPSGELAVRSGSPVFGVRTGAAPLRVLETPGLLGGMLFRAGARVTKIVPWPDDYRSPGSNNDYYRFLAEEARGLRSAGIGMTGSIRPPSAMFGEADLARDVAAAAPRLAGLLDEAGSRLGLFMDGWQWGGDDDASLSGMPRSPEFDSLLAVLNGFAGGLPRTFSRRLGGDPAGGFPAPADIVNGYFPDAVPADRLWRDAAPVFPWLFEPYRESRGARYPPDRLARLAPRPAADVVEQTARDGLRGGSSISLELSPANPQDPDPAAEKKQLEEMLIRAVYAAALAPDAIYLGDLFRPGRGLLRPDVMGENTLATMARPAFLAAGTVSEMLEGADYLGELGLLPPFEAHVFRRPGLDASVIALWHNGSGEERTLARVEIASGPPLALIDWAGNAVPLPAAIPVRRTPSFVTGLPASLALTRMSVRIAPEPPVLTMNRRQGQVLEVVNHMPRQTPVLFRLRYAARMPDGIMENAWTVSPDELRINLPPATPAFSPGRLRFTAAPDPNSPAQIAFPGGADKIGLKIARAEMSVHSSPPADMLLYLPFRLRSDLDVDIEALERVDDPNFVTVQLKVRWFPDAANRRRGEIRLVPFHVKMGMMKDTAVFPITVKASPRDSRGTPGAPFESVEVRIPRRPAAKTWVGLAEEGGAVFYLAEITDFLDAP